MNISNILVPVDFSDFSYNALDYALFLSDKFNANVMVLHVIAMYRDSFHEKEHILKIEEIIDEHVAERKELLDNSKTIAKEKGIEIETEIIRSTSIPAGILDYVNNGPYDLVVMGNHGNTGLKKFFLGSVSQRVLHIADIPVLTVHKNWKKRSIDNILIPVDFSAASNRSFESSGVFIDKFEAILHLLHVVEYDEHPEYYNISFDPILKANPQLGEYIQNNLEKLSSSNSHKVVTSIREGKAHVEIDNHVDDMDIDLLIMSCRGESLFENILIGSTTEKMVAISECPVLVLPH
ncbi:MAG: universal stress protein [Bacteroidales bacterium]|nr:universal stress protein [Bacteroidales bacterium]